MTKQGVIRATREKKEYKAHLSIILQWFVTQKGKQLKPIFHTTEPVLSASSTVCVIKIFYLWSKKICRLKMIVWSGATFILRWSCLDPRRSAYIRDKNTRNGPRFRVLYAKKYIAQWSRCLTLITRMLLWSKFPMYFGQLLQEHIIQN